MSNIELIYKFIKRLKYKKLLTLFINNMNNNDELNDNNYIFRMEIREYELIIDIYDNISDNRFNRYIFNEIDNKEFYQFQENNVFVSYIYIMNANDSNNLNKLALLFKLDRDMICEYASTFLDDKIVKEIINIIK